MTNWYFMCIMNHVAEGNPSANGSIAQLGEHLPYKQEVTGSSPVVPTNFACNLNIFQEFPNILGSKFVNSVAELAFHGESFSHHFYLTLPYFASAIRARMSSGVNS